MGNCGNWPIRPVFRTCSNFCMRKTGSSMSSLLSATPIKSCAIWRATRTAWLFPMAGSLPWTMAGVHFRWRDSQHGNEVKEMSLEAVEFIRRFLLHVLPSGFVKIRHFGFLANRNRKKVIQQCRELLPPFALKSLAVPSREPLCPVCGVGHLHVMDWGRRSMPLRPPQQPVAALDSS
jgi:Putative transposase